MAHMLATLRGVPYAQIRETLRRDAPQHAKEGFFLEHLWQNADNADEVVFIFRVDDLAHAREFITTVHAQTREEDPEANLPEMKFLDEQ